MSILNTNEIIEEKMQNTLLSTYKVLSGNNDKVLKGNFLKKQIHQAKIYVAYELAQRKVDLQNVQKIENVDIELYKKIISSFYGMQMTVNFILLIGVFFSIATFFLLQQFSSFSNNSIISIVFGIFFGFFFFKKYIEISWGSFFINMLQKYTDSCIKKDLSTLIDEEPKIND